jgi:23S rRNA pseudouridine2605 synthase
MKKDLYSKKTNNRGRSRQVENSDKRDFDIAEEVSTKIIPVKDDISEIRLNKRIAMSGLASRRNADELIKSGKAKVNGKIINDLGFKVSLKDKIEVDGKALDIKTFKYLLFFKPKGYITTAKDEHDRKTIYTLLPNEYHNLKPVGRLDRDSEGLLLLTNNGDFINKISHPKYKIPKTYLVSIDNFKKENLKEIKEKLLEGVILDGECHKADKIDQIHKDNSYKGKQWNFEIVIHEGINRQIRRMFQNIGYSVTALKRIKIGSLNSYKLEKFRKLYEEIDEKEAYDIFEC